DDDLVTLARASFPRAVRGRDPMGVRSSPKVGLLRLDRRCETFISEDEDLLPDCAPQPDRLFDESRAFLPANSITRPPLATVAEIERSLSDNRGATKSMNARSFNGSSRLPACTRLTGVGAHSNFR